MAASDTSTSTAPLEVVNGYFAALARRDSSAAAGYLDPEVVEEITGVGIFRGPDEVRRFFEGLFAAAPDMELIVDRTTSEADRVVVQWRMRGTFDGGPLFNGVQPTGGRLELRGCDVLEVRDGKIVRNTAYQDGIELARGLGMMPPQDSAAERAMIAAFNAATKVRQAVRSRF
jgi:ketosteroid isomerase-like protein